MQPYLCLCASATHREKNLNQEFFLLQKLQTLNLEALEKLTDIFPDLNMFIYVESASLQFVQFLDLKMIPIFRFENDSETFRPRSSTHIPMPSPAAV